MSTQNLYDAIIVGGGPCGLTAALYLSRARYRVLVLEKEKFGGQITITSEVVNYPGIESISGEELTNRMRKQAQNFGAEFLIDTVESFDTKDDIKTVKTKNNEFKTFNILIATGANPRRLGFTGEEQFRGRGVAYCATCDGEFFTGKELLVIGGGFAAAEEAMFLTRYATKVTILVRKDKFSCAKSIVEEVLLNNKIEVKYNTELLKVEGGENCITKATILNNLTKETSEYKASNNDTFGVFVFVGYVPNSSLVKDVVALDEQGYIITDSNMQTNVKGVYAGGDICIKTLRQVVTATADGALAAASMEKNAQALQEKTGLLPKSPDKDNNNNVAKTSAPQTIAQTSSDNQKFVDEEMIPQLNAVFERMEHPLVLEVCTGGLQKGYELLQAMKEIATLTDKLSVIEENEGEYKPCVKLIKDGKYTGLAFHGVPGGHEFTSFILGIYNASGQGQQLDENDLNRINSITKETKIKVLISLSCTMCPDLVVAAQKIATRNENIQTEVFDLNLYTELRNKYKVMSVPCLVVNDEHITFGKKNISELLDYLEKV